MANNQAATRPVDRLKQVMSYPSVVEQFQNALGKGSDLFVASLIDLYGSDGYLQKCEPKAVVMEALKAATLRLPINKSLGFAYVVPYKGAPQFQIGYKGLIQLAMRTGQYRYINADVVCEGELLRNDKLTGEIELGEPASNKAVGYFAMIETINGFRKVVYWTKEKIEAHARRFSASFKGSSSPWKSDFDAMAIKTVLKALLGKYGIMSVEMAQAFDHDAKDHRAEAQAEVDDAANMGDFIDIQPEPESTPEPRPKELTPLDDDMISDEEKAEIEAMEKAQAEGPDF